MKSVDKYVYPDTNILINKFDCCDEDKLREIEVYYGLGTEEEE